MTFLQRRIGSARGHSVVTHFDAYRDGTLAKAEKSVYEQHLRSCRECGEWVRRQENLVARLEREMAPAAVLSPAAAARIQKNLYHAMRRRVIMNNMRASVAGAGALALLFLAVGVVIWWQSGGITSGVQLPAPLQAPSAAEFTAAEQAAPVSPSVAQELDELLNTLQKSGAFSGSVLVARGDEIILSEGYGMADAGKEIANTPQTRFRIDQMTEAFTAVAIMQLQDQGKLTVDDPICDYLDACPAAWEAVTIHHLLSGSSGISDYVTEGGPLDGDATPVQLLNRVTDLPLEFEPGSDYHYSHSGYLILGMIIERVAGQPYLAFLQENIFDPLGMDDTGIDAEDGELAVGYRYGSKEAEAFETAPFFATASLYSSVEDLYRFSRTLRTGELLSQAANEQLLAPHFPSLALGSEWFKTYSTFWEGVVDGRRLSYIRGDGPYFTNHAKGFQSVLVFYPDDDLTVIIQENLGSADPFVVARQVARELLGGE